MMLQKPACLWFFCLLALTGCTFKEPVTLLHIHGGDGLNPDARGQPTSVVVRVFELADREAFTSSGFFRLYDTPHETLGKSLISMREMVLRPARSREQVLILNQETRHIAVMAAFRDIDQSQWRLVSEVDPNRSQALRITVDGLAVSHNSD